MSLTETAPLVSAVKTQPREIRAPHAEYNVSIGYLRAFVTVLVVAHHAALAYATFSPPVAPSLTAPPRWWQAFPLSMRRNGLRRIGKQRISRDQSAFYGNAGATLSNN